MGVQRGNQEKKVLQLEELLEERWECKGRFKRRKYCSCKNYWKKDWSAKGVPREESIAAGRSIGKKKGVQRENFEKKVLQLKEVL
jgi:hypothetical protein